MQTLHSLHRLHTANRQGLGNNEFSKNEINNLIPRVIAIKGPFNSKNQLVKFISRNQEYYYTAQFDRNLTKSDILNLKWAISFDENKAKDSFYLFPRGTVTRNREVRISLITKKAKNKFRLYAYFDNPSDSRFLEVHYKKSITFFIGGAGDAESYYGYGPTNIVQKYIERPFKVIQSHNDFTSHYIGYNKAYKDRISSEIISKIPNKEGTQINIVGHSLGGWNGAHLSQILTDKGYQVDLLITLDPVGTKIGVTLISNIYWATPKPKYKYWINVYISPENYDSSDFIADVGGQWIPPANKVSVMHISDTNHWNAGKMFKDILYEGTNASDLLLFFSNLYLTSE